MCARREPCAPAKIDLGELERELEALIGPFYNLLLLRADFPCL